MSNADRDYAEGARVVDALFGRGQRTMNHNRDCDPAPLTAAQLEAMIRDASDPHWRPRSRTVSEPSHVLGMQNVELRQVGRCSGCGSTEALLCCHRCLELRCANHIYEGYCSYCSQSSGGGSVCGPSAHPDQVQLYPSLCHHCNVIIGDANRAPRLLGHCLKCAAAFHLEVGSLSVATTSSSKPPSRCGLPACNNVARLPCPRCGALRCGEHRDRGGYCVPVMGLSGCAPEGLKAPPKVVDPWDCTVCGIDLKRDPEGRHWDPADSRGYCDACWKLRKASITTPAIQPPPVPATTRFVYCEHAPPRELVQRVVVRCGTGTYEGQPVMAPMVWTWRMRREWERHNEFLGSFFTGFENDGYRRHDGVLNIEQEAPDVPDVYGGVVVRGVPSPLAGGAAAGFRCRLCGGWLRKVDLNQ